ncbi:response regulator, partial [Verrucomicrobia bacterium]|nr:response regulator [Verrucomicrobiota bacterium]
SLEAFLQGESAEGLSKTVCLIDQQALLKLNEDPQVMGKLKRFQERVPVVFALNQDTDVLQKFKYSIAKPFLIEQFMEKAATIPLEWNQKDIKTEEIPSPILHFEPLQIHVLVAEDHPINCKLAKLYLDNLGCTNRIVHDGNEALAALEEEAFDVVLMDLHMPALDGLEATRQLIKRYEGKDRPRIIALTADNSKNEKQVALEAGMDEFLLKPIKIEKLREALVKQMKISTHKKLRQ